MKNKLFSLVLILLFILGIGIFVFPQSDASNQERRILANNKDFSINELFSSGEEILSDQFYLRSKIVKLYYLLNTTLSSKFGSNIIDDMKVTQLSDRVTKLDDGYLAYNAIDYNAKNLNSASSHGYNINEFDLMFPNVKTYVYKVTRIEEFLNTDYPYQELCWDAMLYQFNPNISYSKLRVDNFDEHKKLFYKSDRHWNAIGAYQGYCDIINMINNDFDIGEPRKIQNTITYPYEFRGGISNHIALLGDYDNITDYELNDIGDFDYYVNSVKTDFFEKKRNYAKNGNNTPYSDYELYFGVNSYISLFDFKNDSKPNLLIFSTSYTNTNNLWIASHFNKTLLIDLRMIPDDFSLKYYIDKYDINLALLATGYNSLFFDGYDYIPIN